MSTTLDNIQFSVAILQSFICLGCLLFAICNTPSLSHSIPYRFEIPPQYPLTLAFMITLSLVCFFIASIALVIEIWLWKNLGQPTVDIIVVGVIYTLNWSFGQFCSYLVFLFRLIDVFWGSAMQVARNTIVSLAIMIILYETMWVIHCAANFIWWMESIKAFNICHQKLFNQSRHLSFIIILILDVLITISMTYLFVTRLYMEMWSQVNDVDDHNLRMIALNQSLGPNELNNRLMHLSVKAAVLSIVTMLSSLLWIAPMTVVSFVESSPAHVLGNILDFLQQVDTVISSLCLILFLTKARGLYRILCRCCTFVGYQPIRRRLMQHRPEQRVSDIIPDSNRATN